MILLHGLTYTTEKHSNSNKHSKYQHIFKIIGLNSVKNSYSIFLLDAFWLTLIY